MTQYFSEEQTYRLLDELGIHVVSDTSTVWMSMCPFHSNSHTPAFAVNKTEGTFYCFNDACGASGDMASLITQITGRTLFYALRRIAMVQQESPVDIPSLVQKAISTDPLPTFKQSVLDSMRAEFWRSERAMGYMKGRGFTEAALQWYGIGYSPKRDMIGVPMHDIQANPIGLIGRTIEGKRFQNSKDLPKKRTLFNIHRAKRRAHGIITEASFDAIRIWQATGIDAVATLGSHFSPEQSLQVNKYFTHLTIFTDDDQEKTFNKSCRKCKGKGMSTCIGHNTGLELGMKIAEDCRGLSVSWAHLDSLKRYDGNKDAGDLTDDQIAYAVDNAVPHFEMVQRAR